MDESPGASEESSDAPRWSITRTSLAQLGGNVAATVFMAVTGIVVARSLGPNRKGVVATLSYLSMIAGLAANLGLGDAAILIAGRGLATLERAVRSALSVLIPATLLGSLIFIGFARLHLEAGDPDIDAAIFAAATAVPAIAFGRLLIAAGNAAGHLALTARVEAIGAGATALGTFVLVFVLRTSVFGAALALAVGPLLASALMWRWARSQDIALRPIVDVELSNRSLRLGLPIQATYLALGLAARVDLLIVLPFLGTAATGHYSVALTMGALVAQAPHAIAVASFPILARAEGGDGQDAELIVRLSRMTLAASLVSAVALAVAIPPLVPLIFGPGFGPAVGPALVLLAGGVVASQQWFLCRVLAARARTRTQLYSYAASLATMVSLDLALIPILGLYGAGIASILGPGVGLVVAWRSIDELLGEHVSLHRYLPGRAELRELMLLPKRLAAAARASWRDPG